MGSVPISPEVLEVLEVFRLLEMDELYMSESDISEVFEHPVKNEVATASIVVVKIALRRPSLNECILRTSFFVLNAYVFIGSVSGVFGALCAHI